MNQYKGRRCNTSSAGLIQSKGRAICCQIEIIYA